jgi:hypothetical protein
MARSAVSNGLNQVGFTLYIFYLKMEAYLASETLWATLRGPVVSLSFDQFV